MSQQQKKKPSKAAPVTEALEIDITPEIEEKWREAEKASPLEPAKKKLLPPPPEVDRYLETQYPGIHGSQNLPGLLFAILREIAAWRMNR